MRCNESSLEFGTTVIKVTYISNEKGQHSNVPFKCRKSRVPMHWIYCVHTIGHQRVYCYSYLVGRLNCDSPSSCLTMKSLHDTPTWTCLLSCRDPLLSINFPGSGAPPPPVGSSAAAVHLETQLSSASPANRRLAYSRHTVVQRRLCRSVQKSSKFKQSPNRQVFDSITASLILRCRCCPVATCYDTLGGY